MGNPFDHAKRKSMTPYRRARIFAAHDERCHKCTRKIRPGEDWDVDHVLALERGGTDDDENLAPICDWCHTDKTANDHATAGHMKRSYTKHYVPGRFRKSRGWR
jgi:5-methylcytosine-specific restriction protein A